VPLAPAGLLLITQQTREAWFNDPNLPFLHNGMHAADNMALADGATVLLQEYCADKKANLPHAGSSFALQFDPQDGFPPYYTVQDLEQMNLWGTLGTKAAQLNICK
jgi:hypothetical protein